VDPIADQFPHVNSYNYAENEPVRHVDLWGLQRVIFDRNAAANRTFMSAEAINRQTSGGKQFMNLLKNQKKIDVVYSIAKLGDAVTSGPFRTFEEFKESRLNEFYLRSATEKNWKEFEQYFSEGKSILIIATQVDDDCKDMTIREAAHSINHEEVAHGIHRLKGEKSSYAKEHEYYFGEGEYYSPETQEIKTNPKYSKTRAKKQLDEIDKILGYE
jgi:hypothetical protein